ncbi:MAG: hypothetical protein SF029_23900 [bacterium]|nr:hypothetical protein [bacterium]
MRRIQMGLTYLTRNFWRFMLVLGLNFAAFNILFALEGRFESLAGVPTFDTQNDLTTETLLQQLPLYAGEARTAYFQFAAFDFVFPFVAAFFLAVLWTLLLRINGWPFAASLLRWNFPLLAFAGTLFDWLENISLLALLNSGSAPGETLLNAAILFKQLKLTVLTASVGITVVLLVLTAAYWLLRVVRSSRGRQDAQTAKGI